MSNKIVLSKDLVIRNLVGVTIALSLFAWFRRSDFEGLMLTLYLLVGFYVGVFSTLFFGGLRSRLALKEGNNEKN